MQARPIDPSSVESRASWVIAIVTLIVLAIAYGAPLMTAVAIVS